MASLWILIIGVPLSNPSLGTLMTMDETIVLEPGMSSQCSIAQRPLSPAVVEVSALCPYSFLPSILPNILWA